MRRTMVGLGLGLALLASGCSLSVDGSSAGWGAFGGTDRSGQTSVPSEPSEAPEPSEASDASNERQASEGYDCPWVDASTWTVHPTGDDLPEQVGAGTAPGPDGLPTGPTAAAARCPTPDDFLAQSNVPDRDGRREVMVDAGYAGGIEAGFGEDLEVQVLTFGSVPGAVDYFAARLPNLCGSGGVDQITPLSDDGGIAWVDTLGAAHAEFFLGTSQVSLIRCYCGGVEPTVAEMQAWYREWIEGLSTGSATPVA